MSRDNGHPASLVNVILLFFVSMIFIPLSSLGQAQIGASIQYDPSARGYGNANFRSAMAVTVQGNLFRIKNDVYLFSRLGVFYQPETWNRGEVVICSGCFGGYDGRRFGFSTATGLYVKRNPVSGELGLGYSRHKVLSDRESYGVGTFDVNLAVDVKVISPIYLRGAFIIQTPLATNRVNTFLLRPTLGLQFRQ